MVKKRVRLHYIPEWRQFRKLSLRTTVLRMEFEPGEELISASQLNRIERGENPLDEDLLNALSHAFDCEPTDILQINPLVRPELIDLMEIIRKLKNKQQVVQATNVLRAIA